MPRPLIELSLSYQSIFFFVQNSTNHPYLDLRQRKTDNVCNSWSASQLRKLNHSYELTKPELYLRSGSSLVTHEGCTALQIAFGPWSNTVKEICIIRLKSIAHFNEVITWLRQPQNKTDLNSGDIWWIINTLVWHQLLIVPAQAKRIRSEDWTKYLTF